MNTVGKVSSRAPFRSWSSIDEIPSIISNPRQIPTIVKMSCRLMIFRQIWEKSFESWTPKAGAILLSQHSAWLLMAESKVENLPPRVFLVTRLEISVSGGLIILQLHGPFFYWPS